MQSERRVGASPASHLRRSGTDLSRLQAFWSLVGITLLGSALRIIGLDSRSFWLDETTSVRQASWSVPDIITRMSDNVHPPLFHIMLHYWMKVLGRSEISVRSFALVFGILAIPLIYWAAQAIYGRKVGVIAAGIIAVSPFFVWYSQEARMYTLMLFFAAIGTGAMFKALDENRWWWWLLFGIATGLGSMTQYFYFFLVGGQALFMLFYLWPRHERWLAAAGTKSLSWLRPWTLFADAPELGGWLGAMVIAALPSVWWIPKVLAHPDLFSGITQPFNYGWTAPNFGVHFNDLILVPVEWLFGFHSTLVMRDLVAMWPLLITVAFLGAGYSRRLSPRTWYLVLSGIGGTVIVATLGTWEPILEARYFTALTVPLVILLAHFVAGLKPAAFKGVLALVLAISFVGLGDQTYNPDSIVKWDNRQAMGIIARDFRPGDVILLIPSFASSIPEYYLPYQDYTALIKVPSYDRRGLPRNTYGELSKDLDREIGPAERVWVIATWQDTPLIQTDRNNTGLWLLQHQYRVALDSPLYRIRITRYERSKPRSFFVAPEAGVTQ